ncbi:MAG: hypothetical protein HYZ36_02740 [Pedosphaera parvula]|nr:hypothetical protein [Pedosphaera parvula]
MHKRTLLILMAAGPLLAATARAQVTNLCCPVLPATRLEALEARTGPLIIKGSSLEGMVAAGDGVVSVTSKADADTTTGHKEHGLRIRIAVHGQPEERVIIDYDEMAALLKALDELGKMGWSVTTLSSFDAFYTTRGGFRMAAFGVKRSGAVEYSLATHPLARRIKLTPTQLAQFRELIDQAKRSLDTLASQ